MRRRIAYGQNFLVNAAAIDHLLDQSSIGEADVILEIGPGEGVITELLAHRVHHVIAIEKDPQLVARLRRRFAGRANVTVFESDFLAFPLPATSYKVFANLPFNITAAVVAKLSGAAVVPGDTYLAVQREAAARFAGYPEAGTETLAAVLLKPWFEPAVVHRFERTDFMPAPGVDVVMLRLRKRGPPVLTTREAQRYRDLVAFCFTGWHGSVGRALARLLDPAQLDHVHRAITTTAIPLPEEHRPASLWDSKPTQVPFAVWVALYHALSRVAKASVWRRLAGAEDRLRQQQAGLQKVHRTRVRPPPATRRPDHRLRIPA